MLLPLNSRLLQQSILRSMIVSSGIKLCAAMLTFLMFLFLARVLGPESYGRFAAMYGIGGFLAFVALFGQHTFVLRWLSAWQDPQDAGQARWALKVGMLTTLVGGLLSWAGLALVAFALKIIRPETDLLSLILAGTLVLPMAFAEFAISVLRSYGSVVKALLPRDILWRASLIAAVLLIFHLGDEPVSVTAAFLVTAGLLGGLVCVQMYWVRQRLPTAIFFTRPVPNWSTWRQSSPWYWLAAISGMMAGYLAVVVVAAVLPDVETGAFFGAQKVAQLLQLPLIAINIVAAPLLARRFRAHDILGMQRLCRNIVLMLAPLVVGGFLVLVFLGPWLLSLFDAGYTFAEPALLVAGLAAVIHSLSGPSGTAMLMASGEKAAVIVTFLAEGFGLLLIPPLALAYGVTGAAIAVAVGTVSWNLLAILWCRRRIGMDPSVLSLFFKVRT